MNHMSNYPPGMTNRDMDHVNGTCNICPDCGEELNWEHKEEVYFCPQCRTIFDEELLPTMLRPDIATDMLRRINREENGIHEQS